MKRAILTSVLLLLLLGGAFASDAGAFELPEPDKYSIETGSIELSTTQAGAHADFTTSFELSQKESQPYAFTKDVIVRLPAGIFGNPEGFRKCTAIQFATIKEQSHCPFDSQVGSTDILLSGGSFQNEPVYDMPSPGGDIVARFGFYAALYPTILDVRLDPQTESLVATVEGASVAAEFVGTDFTFWGVPADKSHDLERITPVEAFAATGPAKGRESDAPPTPFMTNPTSCGVERHVGVTAVSYQLPESPVSKDLSFPSITGCGALEFNPSVTLKPTTSQGTTGSGLDYELELPTKGLEFGSLNSASQLRRAEVALPEGMSINPSEAEGLGVCSEADLARETYNSAPNVGCPETAKIGSVLATTPVVDREARGALFLAKPYQNPFHSLLALYMVIKVPDRGVMVKLAGRVTTDPLTGQITTVFDDVPELPVAEFKLHFREGARAPLVTPATCGAHTGTSLLSPWSAPGSPVSRSSPFAIESGPSHGPCPTGGLPPFRPGLVAGTINNAAGSYSPFNVRLTRTDAEQEITHFSIKLPPGVIGKLAGIPFCPDAAIAAAKARTGIHGGEEELNAPSCPPASEIGHTLAGAGVGDVLTYVPGKLYLAGPYHGSAISLVSITAAKAGPFDLGTVVVREAFKIDPETAEVFLDATGSDPIPHIIAGIPVHLRDIRAYTDRPEFVLNPTGCERTSTASTLLGSGLDFGSEADDRPVTVSTPFQAADCAALGFEPKLSLKLKGGTRRGGHPAFSATLRMKGHGESNIKRAQVTLPRSEFLENAHIKTICTRVQFRANQCPAASVYGYAKALTPLLDEPLKGPVFLRSSEHQLPDLVAELKNGQITVDLVGRIDSLNGRIRNTFEATPDAPVKTFTLTMQGGKKGLLVNSTNLCQGAHRAIADFSAHNGKEANLRPELKARCAATRKGKAHEQKHHNRAG